MESMLVKKEGDMGLQAVCENGCGIGGAGCVRNRGAMESRM